MWRMEDPDLIATLIPMGDLTKHVFSYYKSNEGRYLPPTGGFNEDPVISSREATPVYAYAIPQKDDGKDNYEKTYRLLLNFDKPPKDPSKGYAFGTDQQKCDVVLGSRGVRGISGVHFHISFDVINKKRRLVLRDSSTNGTAVSYDGQAEEEVRHHFPWILNLEKDEVEGGEIEEWKIRVHLRGLEFKVELASHRTCEVEYIDNVMKFLKFSRTADPPLDGLSIDSHTTEVAPSQSRTPGQRPVYISEGSLGKGSFGQVDRVIDVSVGAIYARKTFFEPSWARDEERKKAQREKWLDKIRREIRIMREHPHVSMIHLRGRDER